jgi:hypothetical protein
MGKERKEIGKKFRKLGKIVREIRGRFWRDFLISGRRRDLRDGGDGEADRPSGPRRARDSRHGGRPQRWEGTRGCWPGCGQCRRDSRYARRGERGDSD